MTEQIPQEPVATPIEVDPAFARAAASGTLTPVGSALDNTMAAVGRARATADTWVDEFWAASGYDKEEVLAALAELEKLASIYAGTAGLSGMHDFAADADVLSTQAPPAAAKPV